MTDMVAMTLTAVFLMLALGMRHGIDPEHLAIVNSVTMRAVETGRRHPVLCGLYFALGHGLIITAVAMGVTDLLGLGHLPAWITAISEWLPMSILFVVATVNLIELIRPETQYQPKSVKTRFLPGPLRDSAHPLAVFSIGILFAPFVDPATQTAVWAYVIGISGGGLEVAALGCVFTLSMAVTLMLGSRGMLLLAQGANQQRAERRRRALGWFIVVFSYGIVGYDIGSRLFPQLGLTLLLAYGCALGAAAVLAVLLLRWQLQRQRVQESRSG